MYNDSYLRFDTRFPNKNMSGCYTGNFTDLGECRDNMGAMLPPLTQDADDNVTGTHIHMLETEELYRSAIYVDWRIMCIGGSFSVYVNNTH